MNTEEEHDVVAAASAEVPPTPPGDTGTWRRLSRPLNQPANPGTANGRAETKHSRSFRITDNISLRMRLTLIYGMLFFAAGSLLLLLNYVILVSVLDKPDFTVHIDGYQLESEIADEIKAALIDGIATQVTRYSVLALIVVGVLAVGLGYAVAGRALSPLHKITRTARRLSERSLHERIAMSGPDDEIRELADTFDAMLERLDRAFDGQRRFVANASHELRTPLAINRTLLEVAVSDPEASPDLKTIARTLLETNARHERLIDGLLFLAKSDRELDVRTVVDLGEVTETVLSQLSDEIEKSGLRLRTDLREARVTGDPVLLERLVSNLVENALRYNVPNGEITVRSGINEGAPAIQVENSGPVVPAYEIEGLFEPFRRGAGHRVSSTKSAGLGLSIVRSVVRAHHGTVTVWPRAGGGLVVTVHFPVSNRRSEGESSA
ncbi:HAMP domain-containing sensor histidine kinase [Thermobifida fusca]|uniref:histidine kinase n=2 Tax=Thermobifida fusca TaxID=2021 RepID=A0A9P2T9C6_THEFU|nr:MULTISPECIES: ATP-binding protein [Thermobifida]AAZ55973.1 ATP-binding region, ATPase-like:Histidine kinase, HAMP region:Histidine kinase A, N-terminal [Thermobifida fusca YX]EOR71019.1 sensor histidine kinase [Thermobifida fusca TM51]MBO2528378.1 two-component sensor histidine kinase [Thermobifida sp.]MDD6791646.1 ATP-binding protein [Thermobifida fusca]PPS91960.1 histidine kinase [Thermobifida fusca]